MASAVIGALRVNLGIDTAQFTEGLKGVRASLDNVGKNLQQWGGRLSTYVTAPIAAAGAAIGTAITTMSRDIAQLRNSAQVANAGFEEFQRLAFAAKSVNIEGDKLADIFKDVNDKVGDFMTTGGGEMADFFTNIAPKVGITSEAFKNLSGPQALQLYYDSLVKAGVGQQEMTFYLEAVADEATALIPLLRDGGKAFEELGAGASVISAEDAAGLKAYNDATRALGEAVKGLTIALANSGVLEFLTSSANKLTEWVKVLSQTNPEILKWGTIVAGLAAALGPTLVAVGLLATGVAAISAPVALVVAGIAALTAGIIAFWPEIDAAGKAVNAFLFGIGPALQTAIEAAKTKFLDLGVYLEGLSDRLIEIFKAIPGQMLQIGKDIVAGLWNGIKGQWEIFKADVSSLGSSIKGFFTNPLVIRSPSRVMHEVGVNIMQGLSNGMDSMRGAVEGGATSIADSIGNAFSGLGSGIAEAIKGTKEWKDVALDAIRTIASAALSSMNFGGGWFGGLLKGLFGGLIGFAQGGSILPGGAGGIDSQVVAFRKSPDERVDVYDPRKVGDSRHGSDVRVWLDDSLNLRAEVTNIAKGEAAHAAGRVARATPGMVDARNDDRQYRRIRPMSAL